MKQKLKSCFGISSKCFDNKHILFFDFDCAHTNINYRAIIDDLISVLKKYNLTGLHVIKSTNGYNAFGLDKLDLHTVKEILESLNMVDPDFIKYGFRRGYYVLRIDRDKKICNSIYKPRLKAAADKLTRNRLEQSNAHRIFFINVFGIKIMKDFSFDKSIYFDIIHYPSEKNGVDIGEDFGDQ